MNELIKNDNINIIDIYRIGDLWLDFWEQNIQYYKQLNDIINFNINLEKDKDFTDLIDKIKLIELKFNSKINYELKEKYKYELENLLLLYHLYNDLLATISLLFKEINNYNMSLVIKRYVLAIKSKLENYHMSLAYDYEIKILGNYIKGFGFKSSPKLQSSPIYETYQHYIK